MKKDKKKQNKYIILVVIRKILVWWQYAFPLFAYLMCALFWPEKSTEDDALWFYAPHTISIFLLKSIQYTSADQFVAQKIKDTKEYYNTTHGGHCLDIDIHNLLQNISLMSSNSNF